MAFKMDTLIEEEIIEFELDSFLNTLSKKYKHVWAIELAESLLPTSTYKFYIRDRENQIILTKIARFRDLASEGSWDWNYKHFTMEAMFIFHYENTNYELRLFKEDEECRFTEKAPFKQIMYGVVWKFLSINPLPKDLVLVKKILWEALKVYGDNGSNPSNDEYLKELTVELKE